MAHSVRGSVPDVLAAVVVAAVVGLSMVNCQQNGVLSTMMNRMQAMEDKMDSLSSKVAFLDERLTLLDNYEEETLPADMDFKLTSLQRLYSEDTESYNFTIDYLSHQPIQALLAYYEGATPKELNHSQGRLQFSVSNMYNSPVLYIRTPSGAIYTLILISVRGPGSERKQTATNIFMTTSPEHSLTTEEPLLTLTTKIMGNRTVSNDKLRYFAFFPTENFVDFQYAKIYEEEENDYDFDEPIGSDSTNLLNVLERRREGREIIYSLRLNTQNESRSGLMLLEHSIEFHCGACVLYELRVRKPIFFFPDNVRTFIPESARRDFDDFTNRDGNSVDYDLNSAGLVRYTEDQFINKTCVLGKPCRLECDGFGDEVQTFTSFQDFDARTAGPYGLYLDAEGHRVETIDMAVVQMWSVSVGYSATSVVFVRNTTEDMGVFSCYVQVASGDSVYREIPITVSREEQ